MGAHIVGLVGGALFLGFMFELLRRRQVKEKDAALWRVVSVAIIELAVWPSLLNRTAHALGIADPPNLLMFVGVLFLLVVCTHLSWEVSRLEDRSRALAEELALLRAETEGHARDVSHPH